MKTILSRILLAGVLLLICLLGALSPVGAVRASLAQVSGHHPPAEPAIQPVQQSRMPYFRFPPVDGVTISGYFDHNQTRGVVTFYDGRQNQLGKGFYFNCSNPAMYDWVGCADPVSGEGACNNSRELWYDEHHGIDFEYSPNWYTGAFCDPGRFAGITRQVYAPARGQVLFAGYDPNRPANGWHIRIKHDLNGNGNFNDDNFRSVYLHFTAYALAVAPGQIVNEGDYLGLGGSTGYSSSPHLHFEVQRSSDFFQSTYWPVDPFGWQGQSADPYPYAYSGVNLWKLPDVSYEYKTYLPFASYPLPHCDFCGEMLQNRDFEDGQSVWVEPNRQVITRPADAGLAVAPLSGEWLARLGGANNVTDNLYQEFTVPANIRSATLRYQLRVDTDEVGADHDYLYVRLRLPDGTVLQDADFINNTFIPAGQWVQRELTLTDLSSYVGQTVRITFKGTTNDSLPTSFYLEDVSLVTAGP